MFSRVVSVPVINCIDRGTTNLSKTSMNSKCSNGKGDVMKVLASKGLLCKPVHLDIPDLLTCVCRGVTIVIYVRFHLLKRNGERTRAEISLEVAFWRNGWTL